MSDLAPPSQSPPAAVTLLIPGRDGVKFPLDAAVDNTLGRSTEASITIPDRLASRAHAAIRYHTVRKEWILRDVGSRNGTWLNGRRIDVAPLTSGALIRIGASELVFELTTEHDFVDLDEPLRAGAGSASRLSRHGTIVLTQPSVQPAAAAAEPSEPAGMPVESLVMHLPSLNLREWQRTLIVEALRRHAGDVTAAAADLGVDARRLHDVLARHGLVQHS